MSKLGYERRSKMEQEPELRNEQDNSVLGDKTGVSAGLLIGITSVMAAIMIFGAGAIYWSGARVAEFSTKIDNLTLSVNRAIADGSTLQMRLSEYEREETQIWTDAKSRLRVLEETGSPATRNELRVLEKEISDAREEFRVYKAICDRNAGIKP